MPLSHYNKYDNDRYHVIILDLSIYYVKIIVFITAGGHHLSLGCDTSAGPLGSGQYLHHQPSCTASSSGCTHNEVLHCGCQWSPALQHSPITDLDSIMKQLYGENTGSLC